MADDWEAIRALTRQQQTGDEDEVPMADPDDEPEQEPPEDDEPREMPPMRPYRPPPPPPLLVHNGNVINYGIVPDHPDGPLPVSPIRRERSPRRPAPYDRPRSALADAYHAADAAPQPPPQSLEEFNAEIDAAQEQMRRESRRARQAARRRLQDDEVSEDGTAVNEEAAEAINVPKTDLAAFQLFYSLEPDSWMHVDANKFYTYDRSTGLWNKKGDDGALRHIIMAHWEQLGKFYGENAPGADRIIKLCKSKNPVTSKTFSRFNTQFAIGEMAFEDGVYNILTAQLEPFTPEHYVTQDMVLPYEAPKQRAPAAVRSHVKQILQQLLPEEAQRNTTMMLYAYSGFTLSNPEKVIAQVQGDGNNGKTTLKDITDIVFSVYSQILVEQMLDVGTRVGEIQSWPDSAHGKRWMWQDESTAKKEMDGCKIKRLTGGGDVTARLPYCGLLTFPTTYKFWLAGNDHAQFKPMDQALSDRFINVQMVSTFTNDPAKRARALAGPYSKYVYPSDPDLLSYFHTPEYKAAWIEMCSDYLQMCLEAKAAKGTMLPRFESEFVSKDMYMAETPDPSVIFDRLLQVTGCHDRENTVTVAYLYPRFKDGSKGGYDKSKTAFMEWLKHYVKNNQPRVRYVSTNNRPELRGVQFKKEEDSVLEATTGVDFDQFN